MDDTTTATSSKIYTLILLLCTTIIAGSIPLLIWNRLTGRATGTTNRILSILSCFGGGVFLAVCLLDLLPDVIESVDLAIATMGIENFDFPLAESAVSFGLLLILTIESLGVSLCGGEPSDDNTDGDESKNPLIANEEQTSNPTFGTFTDATHESSTGGSKNDPNDASIREDNNGSRQVEGSQIDTEFGGSTTLSSTGRNAANDTVHSHMSGIYTPSKFRSIMLLLVLSFHSILEGLSVGIQLESTNVWELFFAIVIHKSILAFSASINFLRTMSKTSAFCSTVIFAIMSPAGIALGIFIVEQVSNFSTSLWSGILQGLATGTFLYITFFEVLPNELASSKDKLLKVLSVLIGYSLMFAAIVYIPHQD